MCGFVALFSTPDIRVPEGVLHRMSSRLQHRGPDHHGLHYLGPDLTPCDERGACIALAHRRLAIIDLDPRSNQPMTRGARHIAVFNGEIYNYRELAAELKERGHTFATTSDTEVLLAAYAEWGEGAVRRFTGMFAFVIIDTVARRAFVARDPFGIKPLYWTCAGGVLAFASEIQPLLELPGVSRRASLTAASRYLVCGQTDAGPATLFADVHAFPAAHVAHFTVSEPGAVQPCRYWKPQMETRNWSRKEAAAGLRRAFLDSVSLHLRSDVPVGIALSGGIDSSAIAGACRELLGSGSSLSTFSYVAPGSSIDESRWMSLAAGPGVRRHEVSVKPEELVRDLDRLIEVQGEPFGSSSIYAQFRVMRLAAEHGIKVMIDGQGADELFAGYRPYLAARLAALLQKGQLAQAARFLQAVQRQPGVSRSRVALQSVEVFLPPGLRTLGRRVSGTPLDPPWLKAGWLRNRGALGGPPPPRRSPGALKGALQQSLEETVLPALLRYEDRNSMAFAIESRVPFLTTDLADLAYSCADGLLVDDEATSKSILRDALRGLVPDPILDRRDKIGFATPEQEWLDHLAPWARNVLQSGAAQRIPFIDIAIVQKQFDRVLSRERPFDFQAWRWLNFIRWSEIFDVQFG